MANQDGSRRNDGEPDIGGAGNQHNDWGHSDVGGNQRSAARLDDVVGSDTGLDNEQAGELQPGLGGVESLSTGHAGSRQPAGERGRNRQ